MKEPSQETEQSTQLLFPLGQCFVTPGIRSLIDEDGLDITPFIQRHITGDDGDLSQEDKLENEQSLKRGFRILSAYQFCKPSGPDHPIKFWVITEADRSMTTILLSEEY